MINTRYVGTIIDTLWFKSLWQMPHLKRKEYLKTQRNINTEYEKGINFIFSCLKDKYKVKNKY